jgi:hypothetical protein
MKNQLKRAIINLLNTEHHSHPQLHPPNMIIMGNYHKNKENLIYKDKIYKVRLNLRIIESKVILTKINWNNCRNL